SNFGFYDGHVRAMRLGQTLGALTYPELGIPTEDNLWAWFNGGHWERPSYLRRFRDNMAPEYR
ncbi:MAG TPA: hypothetical protein VLH79_04260, partial [Chthonomonadales bacterium]|nr:hypothetical protein [Chthonomonadales bacterium]